MVASTMSCTGSYENALRALERRLAKFTDDQYTSTLELIPVGPIEEDDFGVYEAVREVEKYCSGKLPSKARILWNQLLAFSREQGGDPHRSNNVYMYAGMLHDWVTAELMRLHPTGTNLRPEPDKIGTSYLELCVDRTERVVSRSGSTARFDRKEKPWKVFLALYEHGPTGLKRKELFKAVWPDTVVAENNLDQRIRDVNQILETLNVNVERIGQGVVALRDLQAN